MALEAPLGSPGSNAVTIDVDHLLEVAWVYRERAHVSRPNSRRTRVGAAALAEDGTVFGGCSVQQRYHAADIHAEVNAITTLLAEGRRELHAIAMVAEDAGLTPCGHCLDWILQVGGDRCLVVWQSSRDAELHSKLAGEMLPWHPRYRESEESEE